MRGGVPFCDPSAVVSLGPLEERIRIGRSVWPSRHSVHLGVDSLNVVRAVGRLLSGTAPSSQTVELRTDVGLLSITVKLLLSPHS